MNKKIGAMILAMTMVLSLSMTTLASAAVPVVDKSQMTASAISSVGQVYVNNVPLNGSDNMGHFWVDANGRTQAPVRLLVEAMGYTISYNKGVVTVPGGPNGDLVITLGKPEITVGGSTVKMDTIGATINGRTYIPLRYVAEALGATVDAKGSATGLIIKIATTFTPTKTINGVADMMLEDCKNVQAMYKKYPEDMFAPTTGLVRMNYVVPNGPELKLDIRHQGTGYEISGLSFGDKAAQQHELVYALIDDVVEETSRQAIKDLIKERSDKLSKDWTKDGFTEEAKAWRDSVANTSKRVGNVVFTWNKTTFGFTISKASN